MYQRGMRAITNNTYGIDLTLYTHDRIRNNQLPVVVMIGIGGSFHYFVAFGSSYGKKNGRIVVKYLYIADNSYMTGSNNGFAPYWRNDSPNPGIR